jgi:multiple sugar transport system permease protein
VRDRTGLGIAFVSPWLLGFLIFTLGPVLVTFGLSLTEYRVLTPPRFVGIDNYVQLLTDKEYFWPALGNTLFLFLELPVALILGLALALILDQKVKGMTFYRTVLFLPSIVPYVASALLWRWLLNPEYGLINQGLRSIHVAGPTWLQSPIWSKPGIILADLWGVGGSMIIYLAALQGVSPSLHEAAELDGAKGFGKLWHVTIPAISPVILFNAIMGMIGTFQYFTQAFIMTDGKGGPDKSTLFYALQLYKDAFENFRMGTASAMAWILFMITLIATAILFRTSARWVYYEEEKGS